MSNIFYVMGTGPSVDEITEEEWEYLKNKNTLSFGGWPYCGIPTKYFMTYERPNSNIDSIYNKKERTFDIKLDILSLYKNFDTTLLLYYPEDIEYAIKKGFKKIIPIYRRNAWFYPSRTPWFTDERDPPHTFKQCRAHNFNQPLFRFRGSLSAAINCALILGATEIRLIGIDLNCQRDFYEDTEKWIKHDKVREVFENVILKNRLSDLEFRMKNNNRLDPNKTHITDTPWPRPEWHNRIIRGMSDTIQWMDQEIREEGMDGIYITSKNSKLYIDNKLTYKGIMDE